MGFSAMKLGILNWKEWALLVQKIQSAFAEGNWHVDRVIIPENDTHPSRYRKSEWTIRLTSRKEEAWIQFRIRPQGTYLFAETGKGPKASTAATQSPFGLAMAKHLKSRKWVGIDVPHQERVITLWFSGDAAKEKLGLRLSMIPALPEALLVMSDGQSPERILADSRAHTRESGAAKKKPTPSGGVRKIPEAEIRYPEELSSIRSWAKAVQKSLQEEDLEERRIIAERNLKTTLQEIEKRVRQALKSQEEAENEPDWAAQGEELKNRIPEEGEERIEFGEIEKFFQKAKRKKRRLEEAKNQLEFLEAKRAELSKLEDWQEIEKALGQGLRATPGKSGTESKAKSSKFQWMGRAYVSKEGLNIWVGKSRDENLELTFKHARGNDLWMHVRGRPGAHVLIPLHSGKSASLETLLDAAQLCIFHSGGENWGTTEVDYTFKKHVKRIKDSTEASYTHNKTLMVKPDSARLNRLLGQSAKKG